MNGPLEWIAAIGTIVAAAMVAGDFGRRITGWGFILFSVVSCLWIYAGATAPDGKPILLQNALLLLVNLYGVWQFLLSRKNREKIEAAEKAAAQEEADEE